MFDWRAEAHIEIKLVTDLHLGTGHWLPMPGEKGEYAETVHDIGNKPFITGSTLKGALRRLADRTETTAEDKELLFGKIRASSERDGPSGRMGALLVRGAAWSSGPEADTMPYAAKGRPCTFIAARTAVDDAHGVADAHKLFFAEYVPSGTVFDAHLVLINKSGLAALQGLLATMNANGLTMGRGQSDGQGECVALCRSVSIRSLDPASGELKGVGTESVGDGAGLKPPGDIFRFHCAGPFIINDGSWVPPPKKEGEPRRVPQLKAQRRAASTPLVMGSAISGALRARAEWFAAREALNDPNKSSLWSLAVDLLFGHAGQRALLQISGIRIVGGRSEHVTSLKIDRFSAAPVDGALFTAEVFSGTSLEFGLRLASRGSLKPTVEADLLFKKLKSELGKGLKLGLGTNKGFGWFQAE